MPLPEAGFSTDLVTSVPSDKTAFVTFDTNRYSVPTTAANRTLTLFANDVELRLCEGAEVVATHTRSWTKNDVIEAPEHRAALLAKNKAARLRKGRNRLRRDVPRAEELLTHWLDDGRNVGSLASQTLKLLDLYGAPVLIQAVAELLDTGSHDYGRLAMLCEQRRTRPRRVLPLEFAPHVVERDVIPHDLGAYDDDHE